MQQQEFNAASMALFDGDRFLLIRRARSPFLDHWSLPGGRRERGETALQCAIREAGEETGLSVFSADPVTVLNVGLGRPFHLAVFASRDFEGELTGSDEISAYGWFSETDLPNLLTTPELPEVIAMAKRVVAHDFSRL